MPRRRPAPTLIGALYGQPALRVGDVATCLYRDCDVRISCWTDAPISWPRCSAFGRPGGGSGLLVNEELLRAIRTESALALQHYWGVSDGTVTRWRRAFGVEQWGTQGSRLLLDATIEKAADAVRGRVPSEEELAQRVATHMANGGYEMPERWAEAGWKPEELAMVGTMPDEELARRIGKTQAAVRACRGRLGRPAPSSER
jgi:hypothetical protein